MAEKRRLNYLRKSKHPNPAGGINRSDHPTHNPTGRFQSDYVDGSPELMRLKVHAINARSFERILPIMKGEFTTIIEESPEGGYWAICATASLREVIRLILSELAPPG